MTEKSMVLKETQIKYLYKEQKAFYQEFKKSNSIKYQRKYQLKRI